MLHTIYIEAIVIFKLVHTPILLFDYVSDTSQITLVVKIKMGTKKY